MYIGYIYRWLIYTDSLEKKIITSSRTMQRSLKEEVKFELHGKQDFRSGGSQP